MPLSPIPNRNLLPKSDAMMCPETVRQSVSASFLQSALISPDNSPRESSSARFFPGSQSGSPAAKPQQDPFQIAREALVRAGVNPDLGHQMRLLAPRSEKAKQAKALQAPPLPRIPTPSPAGNGGLRLNKFVRRLHDMLQAEKDSGVVEWRRGLLVLHSTDAFAKTILPKYFNTRNFKTFRRQLNYYGFVHVRSFSTTGSTTTALWVNRDLAKRGTDDISSVLMLKRVEPSEDAKTAEGRRVRKEMAIFTVEEDIGVSAKTLQMDQIRSLANDSSHYHQLAMGSPPCQIPMEVHCHHSPSPPLPRLAPKMSNSSVVSTSHTGSSADPMSRSNSLALNSQVSNLSHSESYPSIESADSDAEESAACLLLMLSKGGGKPKR